MSDDVDLEAIDSGEQPDMDIDSVEVFETVRGPEAHLNSRVPQQLKRALELAANMGENVNQSDLIRKALFDFLSENNREALIQAKAEIEDEMEYADS